MWKLAVGFVVFAAIALFVLSKGGDIDLSGEKHGVDATHVEPAKPAEAAPAAAAPAAAAPAASAAK
jgi:hypothetical protein